MAKSPTGLVGTISTQATRRATARATIRAGTEASSRRMHADFYWNQGDQRAGDQAAPFTR